MSLHHSRYRPCSALEGFVSGCWVTVNSSHLNRPLLGDAAFFETEPTDTKNTGKVTPGNPRRINSIRWSRGDRLRSLGYEEPFYALLARWHWTKRLCCEVDLSDWHSPRPITWRLFGYPLLPVSNQKSRFNPQCSCYSVWTLLRCFEFAGVPPKARVTRNTARHGRRSVCQRRLGLEDLTRVCERFKFHHDAPH